MIQDGLEFLRLLRQRRLSKEELRALQWRKLKRVAHHAYSTSAFYREHWAKAGFAPDQLKGLDDLERIPIIVKDNLQKAGVARLTMPAEGLVTYRTSGYSGKPLLCYATLEEGRRRRLREFRALIACGVRPNDRIGIMGPEKLRSHGIHQKFGLYRMSLIPHDLPPEAQAAALAALKPAVLWVYPTLLHAVVSRHGNKLSGLARPRILITSSHCFEEFFREQIRADVNPQMFVLYACMEVGRIAVECTSHKGLHVEEDSILAEIRAGDRAAEPGEPGSVVLTSLDQLAMPIIRYEVGDLSHWIDEPCPCGRASRMIHAPLGRNSDMVTLADGTKVSSWPLDAVLRRELTLQQYRFVQQEAGRLEAQLAFLLPPREGQLEAIRQSVMRALHGKVQVEVRVVDEIPIDSAKFKTFISSL